MALEETVPRAVPSCLLTALASQLPKDEAFQVRSEDSMMISKRGLPAIRKQAPNQ